ncbi:MAG: membrane-bound lytic murein transglycosylase MltF [Pseudomonadota bacterium]
MKIYRIIFYLAVLLTILFLASCAQSLNKLQQIKNSGELKVLIQNIPGIYYEGPFGPVGFDYDLAKLFAEHLGVKLVLINKPNVSQMLKSLKTHQADMATGRIIKTEQRIKQFHFSTSYHHLNQQLIYRSGQKYPKKLQQLDQYSIEVIKDSSQEELLFNLKNTLLPKLDWHSNEDSSVEGLLDLVNEKVIDFTIANSDEVKINQRFYPELRIALSLAQDQPISWAFTYLDNDSSLVDEANKFLDNYKRTHQLTILTERYYGHIDQFDYVDTRVFQRHIKTRLPKFQEWFKKAGQDQRLDWNLLAAISYQESHWKNDATSPTGVKGLMMLTHATAEYIGVNNRLSPYQSIFGGAEYFSKLLKRLPDEVKEPDKTYFALASYNMGYGHLSDARKLCKLRGLDNTKWANLKQVLPLLQRTKWHKQTRYGYARGYQAVHYVKNIRRYYDILKWQDEEKKKKPEKIKALDIIVPAL